MGSGSVAKEAHASESSQLQKPKESHKQSPNPNTFSIDVIEVSNIALAIKNGDQHVINIQITISCKNLPKPKTFEVVHTIVVLYKMIPQKIQIGRTEVVSGETSPKFVNTFLLPSVSGNDQKILIHIYNVEYLAEDKTVQKLIGTTQLNLQNLIDNDSNQLQVNLADSSAKQRTMVHVSGCEYNGGGTYYEVILQATEFKGKLSIYYVIEVQKQNDWYPVAKSNSIQIKSIKTFEVLKVSSHKFPGEQTSRIRFRCYDTSKGKAKGQIQLGYTDYMVLGALVSGQQKGNSKRIEKDGGDGGVIGIISVISWKKVNQDSFLNYVVNGARLHLILGIDFTKSTFEGSKNFHHPQDDKNLCIMAINQIVGMLQYFDYYNQIALYGFGAKLPPHYKSMGQCFALNGNYFQPLVVGGVQKIIKLYRENLSKVQPHGPSKLSEIISMAIKFAKSAQSLSTNYYVLIILTDGTVDDYNDTVQMIIQGADKPLSIVFVGLGDGNFDQLKKLDQDDQALVSSKSPKVCKRDMIDFIDFKQYLCQEKNLLTQMKLARKTFAEIPKQFVSFMQSRRIRPNKQKKGIKTAKSEFISEKINASKNKQVQTIIPQVQFLKEYKKQLIRKLLSLGIQPGKTFDQTLQISMNDQNYFLQIYASKLPPPIKPERPFKENISFHQQKRFEQRLQKNQKVRNNRIQGEIVKKQANQMDKRQKMSERIPEPLPKKIPKLRHPCLKCKQRQICIIYGECGHLAVCQQCQENICILCKQFNNLFFNIHDYDL